MEIANGQKKQNKTKKNKKKQVINVTLVPSGVKLTNFFSLSAQSPSFWETP